MAVLQQPYTTLAHLEHVAIATKAIQALPVVQRRDAIKSASGLLEAALRTRHKPPWLVEHDPDFDDLSGMTGGALPIWTLEAAGPILPGGQARPMDVQVTFPAGGFVGAAGITYNVNADAGAYATSAGPTLPFPVSGIVPIGGYPFQLPIGAAVNAGDSLLFSLRTDAGLMTAAALLAAWLLLHARGVDAATLADMQKAKDTAEAWVKSIATGDGDLDKGADATPTIQEGGVRFKRGREQKDAFGWVGGRGRW